MHRGTQKARMPESGPTVLLTMTTEMISAIPATIVVVTTLYVCKDQLDFNLDWSLAFSRRVSHRVVVARLLSVNHSPWLHLL